MHTSATLRRQIEDSLAQRIPGALTPRPRLIRDLTTTGIAEIDRLLDGGLPIGAIAEFVGPVCSGRTTLALSVLAGLTAVGKVVAWVDAADTLDPQSAAAAGVDLNRQLWVRCGAPTPASRSIFTPQTACAQTGAALLVEGSRTPAPSGGGGSPHPRGEARGLSEAIDSFLQPETFARTIAPRGPDPGRPNLRSRRIIGTPGAPNRKLTDLPPANFPASFPQRASDREEQVATDRLPSRRGAQLKLPDRPPRNLSAAQIAFTGAVAGAWTDNRNNAAGRSLKTAPNAIAAGLPRFRAMEARASGQGHGQPRGPFEGKPLLNLPPATPPSAGSPETRVHQAIPLEPGLSAAQLRNAKAIPMLRSDRKEHPPQKHFNQPARVSLAGDPPPHLPKSQSPVWKALDKALRATDLLLAGGGFSAIVLDLGSIAPEFTWRIPLATWFRFRSGAERSQTVFLLLTQHTSARSAAELVLHLSPAEPQAASTVLTGAGFHIAINRQRFETQPPNPLPPTHASPHILHLVPRKPPQKERSTSWQRSTAWARGGAR